MPESISGKTPIIWVVNQFAGTLESGWGERHYFFSKHWIGQGYDVKIISGSFNHMFRVNKENKGWFDKEYYRGVEFIWVKTPVYSPQSIMRFFSMLVFSLRLLFLPFTKIDRPDVIIVSSMPIFSIIPGIIWKPWWKFNLIFEIRDIWPLTLQLLGDRPAWHPAVKFIGWFEKIGYRKSDAIVSLLPNARCHMERVAGKVLNFHYIPNGIDPVNTESEELNAEIANQIPKDKFVVGYAGTIGLANALEYLVDASILLSDHQDIYFVIVGDGYLKEEIVKRTKGQSNILFFPKIPKSQVQSLLELFDICFVGRNRSPLFQHGVSANKYFDYMLAAKPILDSNDFIKDPVELSGCGILVRPDSAEAIRDGVLFLKNLPKIEREAMGKKGKVYVLKHHDICFLADRYAELFPNAIKKNAK
jgi:glycosyltransferase involved in cell wall biosynthesis